jgi:RNA polymerase sigma-70 factor (ECF subfamily)
MDMGAAMKGNVTSLGERDRLAERFEEQRVRLRAVAYRMLGSLAEADDAVQEAWLRLSRADRSDVENLPGWLTTVVARACLNMLQARRVRREELVGVRLPDPIVGPADAPDPEQQALLADSVGLALQLVLDTLAPAERVAFVLHEVFAVPFEEIAPLVGRSPVAARQLASRARRRVRGAAAVPDAELSAQRAVVDAFLAALRGGDLAALLAVLDPDVVLRADRGAGGRTVTRGARAIAAGAMAGARHARSVRVALVNGAAGAVSWGPDGRVLAVTGFIVRGGRIVEIDLLGDPDRLGQLDLSALTVES